VQEDERGGAGDQEEEDDGDDGGGDDDGDDHAPFSSCLGSHLSAMDSSSPCQLLLAIDSGIQVHIHSNQSNKTTNFHPDSLHHASSAHFQDPVLC
jgi:hypothetical protein